MSARDWQDVTEACDELLEEARAFRRAAINVFLLTLLLATVLVVAVVVGVSRGMTVSISKASTSPSPAAGVHR